MSFFDSRFWKSVRSNKKLYYLIHNTVGLWIKNYRLRDRIDEMKTEGLSTIFEVDRILRKTGLVYFVDFGTLLGFVRKGKPLAWDYDIDFGVCFTDDLMWKDLENAMSEIGFKKVKQFSYQDCITEQTFKRSNIYIDFFSHFIENNSSYYYVYYAEKDYEYDDNNHLHARVTTTVKITGSEEYKVEGGYIHVPIEFEQYLVDVYGENWRIPNPNWSPEGMPNIKKKDRLGLLTEFKSSGTL